ncbi:MAG: DUF1549 domain-containing protein [Planctomycetes bacterium]|nr:DUF1549 domain-containing protein [Planctomycetota bacterium]
MLSLSIRKSCPWFVCLAMGLTSLSNGQSVASATPTTSDEPASIGHVNFELDVQPILVAAGCSTGACHGKARGQNGFQLSLICFDPDFDYAAITKEARGRRVFPAAPEKSLLLQKPSGEVPHGGGKRLEAGSSDYELVRRWIEFGMPRRKPGEPVLESVTAEPTEQIMGNNAQRRLSVRAHYSDGSTRDVTGLAAYQSSESAIVAVDRTGLIKTGPIPGEAAIMARYMGKIAVCNVAIPLAEKVPHEVYAALPRYNFIDGLVWDKLERLGITPSQAAGDSTFVRRAYIDAIGRLPTPDEVRAFLADPSSDKRTRLLEQLLARPEYADYWANKWADLLRPNPYRVGIKAVRSLDAWLRDAFRRNMPYDQFVRELLTAQGSTWRNGAATLFRDRREPEELTTITSQLFLGVRLECAKCHHHPFEIWGQDDFYSFAAFFARIGRKGTGLSPPISGGEEIVYTAANGSVQHPLTGQALAPRPLGGDSLPGFVPSEDGQAGAASGRQEGSRRRSRRGAPSSDPDSDPRETLAAWMTAEDNPYFAKVIVNRVWADLMGRGMVDPVDDIRGTNPPSNGPLLDALADEFRRQGYDLKKLLRTIMGSYVYGLSSRPNERNVSDTRNYSRHYRQRLRAEVLLDAVCDITGVPETFDAVPIGSRALELWTHRSESLFLDSFGRPDPNQDPPCERNTDTTVVQALHLMNSPRLNAKITSDTGRAAQLAASDQSPQKVVAQACAARWA